MTDDNETDGQILARMGTDAAKWTDEFFRQNNLKQVYGDGLDGPPGRPAPFVNWGVMVGWFANAIEAGREAGRTGQT